jgi:GNAT superfamily N-acetyltransferase
MGEITIRAASPDDAPVLSRLSNQLGYDRPVEETRDRIARSSNLEALFVAEVDGEIVGWIHGYDVELVQYPRFMEIGGLVVADQSRGTGIGRRLVEAVVEWGRDRGHSEVRVRSNVIRDGAHAFYEGIGFTREKTSHTFALPLH